LKKRIHITDSLDIYDCHYIQNKYDFKPNGLWYSINDEWYQWISYNMPSKLKKYKFELEIDFSRIIVLKDSKTLKEFVDIYGFNELNLVFIDWEKVSEDYDGIEFSPYFKNNILDFKNIWYNTIDVESGCIWNLDIILKKELI
jgi:hypothetical protein